MASTSTTPTNLPANDGVVPVKIDRPQHVNPVVKRVIGDPWCEARPLYHPSTANLFHRYPSTDDRYITGYWSALGVSADDLYSAPVGHFAITYYRWSPHDPKRRLWGACITSTTYDDISAEHCYSEIRALKELLVGVYQAPHHTTIAWLP